MSASFQMLGLSGSRDERGLISMALPFNCATLDETLSVGRVFPFGLPETRRAVTQLEDGSFQATVTFEGIEGSGESGDSESYEFDSMFREEPIESHPNIDKIKSTYGGYERDGRILFPEKLTSSKSSGSGLSGSKSTSGEKNPLFGMTTYLVLNAVFRHTYLRRTIPGDLLDRVGTTVDRLPESFPTPAGRNWLVMPPKAVKRGNVFEISEEWTLSKPGEKWPDAIYGLIQR